MKDSKLSVWAIVAIIVLKQVAVLCCDFDYFLCPNGRKCIHPQWICDGENDCGDYSDETYCSNATNLCSGEEFQCANKKCYDRDIFCNGQNECGDFSDEFYCNFSSTPQAIIKCPRTWMRCNDNPRCIPRSWKCDGVFDCPDLSDEESCPAEIRALPLIIENPEISVEKQIVNKVEKNPNVVTARRKLIDSFLRKHRNDTSTNRWGPQLHRIATALYLANETFFSPGNGIGDEMRYELTIQLLYKLSGNYTFPTQELALYIQAFMVTCADPRNFYGLDLVSELRKKVERSNYTNPFAIVVLCNAGDAMAEKDVERVTAAFDSQYRPFWTDTQAIATMALQCISNHSNVNVDERIIKDMQEDLKKRQFSNGTVDNPITTAIVIQALLSKESYKQYFDLSAAIEVLLQNQESDGSWGSVRNSYYVLPVLFHKSLLNISNKHCKKSPETEEEALLKLQEARGKKLDIQYSVWIGNDVDFVRTWRVKLPERSTFYDVIDTVRKLDSKHNVKYHVIDNKPYVSALYGKEDDSELGMYWFTYVKSKSSEGTPTLLEGSPVDVNVNQNQELILWYKSGTWIGNPTIYQTDNSPL